MNQEIVEHIFSSQRTWLVSAISATTYTWLSLTLPEELVSFGVKLAISLPLGLLTGIGTALGSMLVKKWFVKKEKS
jgi:hypothetical protein